MNINALLIITSDNRLIMKYSLDAIISLHLVRAFIIRFLDLNDHRLWEYFPH